MRHVWTIPAAILLFLPAGGPAAQESPYAGWENREIKALSPAEIAGYLEGEGMGFALAAELNGYPGPKHVLMMADRLDLEGSQLDRTREVHDRMHREAIRLGGEMVDRERDLDSLFAGRSATPESLENVIRDLARLRGELRFAHLRAHLEMLEILSPAQVETYNRVRGYGPEHHPGHHQQGETHHPGDH